MRQRRDVQVRQDALNFVRSQSATMTAPFIARVTATYSHRMTCDIETSDGQQIPNVPVLTKGGLVAGEPYGEVCLPAVDDFVIVMHGSYGTRHKIIVGTIFPYLANPMLKDAVNSGSKQFTKKLFEENKPLTYRRIFPSGTTIEIDDDGNTTVELPNGTYVKIDSGITIEDANGNEIVMGSSSVTINGNLEVLQ